MTQGKLSLGQSIDQIVTALDGLDADARITAIKTVCAHLKIPLPEGAIAGGAARDQTAHIDPALVSRSGAGSAAVTPKPIPTDIRTLRIAKSPRSAKEMACVVAFYLQEMAPEGESKDTVSTADLGKFFKQAQFKLPEKISQVLPDAKSSGYFDSPSRGVYKLNAVGYNLVAHKLPARPAGE